jgi:hypothetical protein
MSALFRIGKQSLTFRRKLLPSPSVSLRYFEKSVNTSRLGSKLLEVLELFRWVSVLTSFNQRKNVMLTWAIGTMGPWREPSDDGSLFYGPLAISVHDIVVSCTRRVFIQSVTGLHVTSCYSIPTSCDATLRDTRLSRYVTALKERV